MFFNLSRENLIAGIGLFFCLYWFILFIFRFLRFSPKYNQEVLTWIFTLVLVIYLIYLISPFYKYPCYVLWGMCVVFLIIQLSLMYKNRK